MCHQPLMLYPTLHFLCVTEGAKYWEFSFLLNLGVDIVANSVMKKYISSIAAENNRANFKSNYGKKSILFMKKCYEQY